MQTGKWNCILDAFWGSSGKGKASTWLADKYNITFVSSSNFPNAGHTAAFKDGTKFVAKAIPTSAILKKTHGIGIKCFLSPGSGFYWPQLIKEWNQTERPDIFIHSRASIVTPDHAAREREGIDSTKHVASTMQGSATALADKVMRRQNCCLAGKESLEEILKHEYKTNLEVQKLFGENNLGIQEFLDKVHIIDALEFRNLVHTNLENGNTFLHEGSQGYALSIDHGSHYPECLSADSRVLMSDGTTCKIRNLRTKIGHEVVSLDKLGKIVNRKITNWWKHPLNERDWYNIVTETSVYNIHDQQWIGPKFTGDHKVRTLDGLRKVSDLQPGDHIFINEAKLTGDGLQIFLGSMLGDGSVPKVKNYRRRATFQVSHGKKQEGYLLGKAKILSEYIGGSVRELIYSDKSFKPGNISVRYTSHKSISVMRMATALGCFGQKKPDFQSIVDMIDWRGLAIWYQDDGSLKQSGNGKDVILFTNGFQESDVKLLSTLLLKKFGLHFSVNMVKAPKTSKNIKSRYPVLRLSRHDQAKWFNGIQNFMHECMSYKLPDNMHAAWSWCDHDDIKVTTEVITDVIKSRRRSHRGESVCFDIEVENTHNFYVANDKGFFNVENCTSRNCSLQAYMDHMAIPPLLVGDVYLNLRTHPIRVGNVIENGVQKGFSGDFYPDCKELTWEQVAQEAGMPPEEASILAERERTTVTKRIRRVTNFSFLGLQDAVRTNGVTKLIVNFIQYINWQDAGIKGGLEAFNRLSKKSRQFLTKVEDTVNVKIILIGTGPLHDDVIDLT